MSNRNNAALRIVVGLISHWTSSLVGADTAKYVSDQISEYFMQNGIEAVAGLFQNGQGTARMDRILAEARDIFLKRVNEDSSRLKVFAAIPPIDIQLLEDKLSDRQTQVDPKVLHNAVHS